MRYRNKLKKRSPMGIKRHWPYSQYTAKNSDAVKWPKISVVTPSYNQGQYIEETILSVINQNYPNLEYIIIDGGSTDNTVDVIKKYEQHITYWISEPDWGQSHAINKGLAKCTGEVFGWINSDDYYCKNALLTVGTHFRDSNLHILCGYSRRFVNEGGANSQDIKLARTSVQYDLEIDLLTHYFIQVSTFFKCSIVKELGGVDFNLHFVMDSELWLRYLLKYQYGKIKFIDDQLANYRLHDSSKTVAQQQMFREEMCSIYRYLYIELNFQEEEITLLIGKPLPVGFIPKNYQIAGLSRTKFREYAYWNALGQVGGMQDFRRFLKLLRKVVSFSPLSLSTYQRILSNIVLPRVMFKIKNA